MVSGISGSSDAASMLQMLQSMKQSREQSMFKTTDTDGDGSLTLSEFQAGSKTGISSSALESAFTSADADKSGSLSSEEFEQALASIGGSSASKLSQDNLVSVQDMFSNTDSNSDDSLTLDEFIDGAPDDVSDTSGLEELFTEADTDGDGTLSEDEFTSAMANNASPPPPTQSSSSSSDETYDELDTNKDGVVSIAELAAAFGNDSASSTDETDTETSDNSDTSAETLASYFDKDGDGTVTQDELNEGFKNIRTALMSYMNSTSYANMMTSDLYSGSIFA